MIERRLMQRINDKKERLDNLCPLPEGILARIRQSLNLEWIYNSNAIEGSTLSLQETRLILETGLTIGGKSMREHFEVINHQQAIGYVEELVREDIEISPYHIRQIHQLVLTNIDDTNAGQYRNTPVRIAGAEHRPPDAWEIPQLMTDWGNWLLGAQGDQNIVVLAASAHHRLAAIHPFVDGNGRTARLAMNLILMKQGYPPTVIENIHRQQYYRALAQADNGQLSPFVNFIARAVERSLTLYLEAFTPKPSPPSDEEIWILLREAADGTPYSQEYLSLLARKGRLEAVKRGRNWYTSRHAVQEYIRSLN